MKNNSWHLNDILMSLSTATMLIDKDHIVIEWNNACEDLTGIKREEVIGTKDPWKGFYHLERPVLADLIIDDRLDEIDKYYNKFKKANHVRNGYTAENWIEVEGNKMYIIFTACPLYDAGGIKIGAVETLEDITDLKRAEESLAELAVKDPLTGIFNRRYLIETLRSEFYRAERYGSLLAIGMTDIDLFKVVNDTYGHDMGDQVLKKFSEIMQYDIRKTDVCGRLGGDEFLVIFPNSEPFDVRLILERFRIRLSSEKFFSSCRKEFSITASVGIAQYDRSQKNPDELMKIADDALYQAKKLGRDRIYSSIGAEQR